MIEIYLKIENNTGDIPDDELIITPYTHCLISRIPVAELPLKKGDKEDIRNIADTLIKYTRSRAWKGDGKRELRTGDYIRYKDRQYMLTISDLHDSYLIPLKTHKNISLREHIVCDV